MSAGFAAGVLEAPSSLWPASGCPRWAAAHHRAAWPLLLRLVPPLPSALRMRAPQPTPACPASLCPHPSPRSSPHSLRNRSHRRGLESHPSPTIVASFSAYSQRACHGLHPGQSGTWGSFRKAAAPCTGAGRRLAERMKLQTACGLSEPSVGRGQRKGRL